MKGQDLLLALAICVMWGLNFSVIKLGVEQIDPFVLTALRLSLAAFPAVFFVARPQVAMRYIALYGLLFGVGLWGLMSLSIQQGLSAGMASVTLRGSAFFSVLIGVYWFKERLSFIAKAGVMFALLGIVLSFYLEDGSVSTIGLVLALIAGLSLSLLSALVKQLQVQQVFAFVVFSSLFAPLPLLLLAYLINGANVLQVLGGQLNAATLFSIFFQAYPTTLIGYWLWNKLLLRYPMSTMGPLSLLVPVFGVVGSCVFFGEVLTLLKIVAFSLLLIGVLLPFFAVPLEAVSKRLRRAKG